MSIVYSAVKDASKITLGVRSASSEVETLVDRLLQQVNLQQDSKKSYSSKGYTFNYVTEGGICYLCVANENFERRICFSFLERVKTEYKQKGKVSKGFLESEMEYFSTSPDVDKLKKVSSQVEEVKQVMVKNIETALDRGEKIEEIGARTEELEQQASGFRKSAKTLKWDLFRRNIKLTIILIVICVIILVVIAVIIWLAVTKS